MKTRNRSVLLITTLIFLSLSASYAQEKKENKTKDIKTFKAFPEDLLSAEIKQAANRSSLTQTPQNGITYKLISTTQANGSDCFVCPANTGTGKPCYAKYTVENREYTEYKNGVATRVWVTSVSVFAGCGWW